MEGFKRLLSETVPFQAGEEVLDKGTAEIVRKVLAFDDLTVTFLPQKSVSFLVGRKVVAMCSSPSLPIPEKEERLSLFLGGHAEGHAGDLGGTYSVGKDFMFFVRVKGQWRVLGFLESPF
jgi:hypothetical protein